MTLFGTYGRRTPASSCSTWAWLFTRRRQTFCNQCGWGTSNESPLGSFSRTRFAQSSLSPRVIGFGGTGAVLTTSKRKLFVSLRRAVHYDGFSLSFRSMKIPSSSVDFSYTYRALLRWYSFSGAPKNSSKATGITELTEKRYNEIADETLDSLTTFFEEIGDSRKCHPEYDVAFSNGVLTVRINPGETYVINKQTPNRQIWLSSPLSGPKRYDFVRGTWTYLHDGVSLHQLLTTEISNSFADKIDFSSCAHGTPATS